MSGGFICLNFLLKRRNLSFDLYSPFDRTVQQLVKYRNAQNKTAAYKKSIPAALAFNGFSFTHGRSNSKTEWYYISNIKITKL